MNNVNQNSSGPDLARLARTVVFDGITKPKLKEMGFRLKPGKKIHDVRTAKILKSGQRTGDLDEMIDCVEQNLKKVVVANKPFKNQRR